MALALERLMPLIVQSFSGSYSSTLSVSVPKRDTISDAVAGPMPRTARPAR